MTIVQSNQLDTFSRSDKITIAILKFSVSTHETMVDKKKRIS